MSWLAKLFRTIPAYLSLKQILIEENMKPPRVAWTVSELPLRDYKTGSCGGLLFAAFVSSRLKHKPLRSPVFYHHYHENILLVCARVIRQLIYCRTFTHPGVQFDLWERIDSEIIFFKWLERFSFIQGEGPRPQERNTESSRIGQPHWRTHQRLFFLGW